ncbi:COQ9 family protein [Haematospirillum sp. H1815]|uniref:COQ9 family protein n=1 Tax=Haematospirillum sp. H1815 TaxID=2723108 RepID=UPI001438CC32|nr:COQ9 family protein [Haematospirillum sp. H1815]NKD76351.1 COQ9 family protein [Haematospirillum sp. H1815]
MAGYAGKAGANPQEESAGGERRSRQDRLVLAALAHVPFDGWSDLALERAARDCGLPPDAPGYLFPRGVIDAVDHFASLADRLMIEDMQGVPDEEKSRVQDKLHRAVRMRLERWSNFREAVRRGLLLYALPSNVPRAVAATARTADSIWRAVGDSSHDFNWYTKRASISGIYTATLLYWLDDPSDGCEKTWDFLHRSLDGMGRAIKARSSLQKRCAAMMPDLPGILSSFGYQAARRGSRRM